MSNSHVMVAVAASFAARAHLGQLRKDGRTPYIAHPVRVCLSLTTVFGVHDPEILATALLHDTIEDTTTDYDDLLAEFGPNVANWVRALTKDKRLADAQREEEYVQQLLAGGWQVHLVKLADIYDNLSDFSGVSPEKRKRSLARAEFYLIRLESQLAPEARAAFAIVQERFRTESQ